MSICVAKLPHDTEYCTTKQGLQVFADEETGKLSGYCFSCETYVPDPYGEGKTIDDIPTPKKKTPAQIAAEVAEVGSYQTLSLNSRKLGSKTLEQFGVKVAVSERDGKTPIASYWPITKEGKITGYHVKPLWEGGFPYNLGDVTDGDLIGWEQAKKSGAYKLIITEGPEDAASVYKIFMVHGKKDKEGKLEYPVAVVSLPRGAGSARSSLTKHAKDIKNLFKEVILCFDDDTAGYKATKEASLILPTAKTVTLPCKDANDCLKEGVAKAAFNALSFHAHAPISTSLIRASDLHALAREPAKWGQLSYPWPKLNDALRGIRYKETIYIGAGVKMGKGEVRNSLISHFIEFHDTPVFVASYEEAPTETYKRVVGKIAHRILHDPKKDFDFEAYDKAGEIVKDKLFILDRYQRAKWEDTKADMISAADGGVKAFFIDPITQYTNGVDAGQANTMLQTVAQESSELAADLDAVIFLFCHLRAPEGDISSDARQKKYAKSEYWDLGNCPHETGGTINSNQFAGSRAMMRSANIMLGIEGNKDDDLREEVRNTRRLKILEERAFGMTGTFSLFWNNQTGVFEEL